MKTGRKDEMRETKFRQPMFDDKGKFIDWFYWGFINGGFISPLKHNVNNYQFTGLLDKNGIEIYEGDIVRIGTYFDFEEDESGWVDESIHEVVWGMEQGYPAFDLKPWVDCDTNALQLYASICNESAAIEVIGNIYEHPHLLENKR